MYAKQIECLHTGMLFAHCFGVDLRQLRHFLAVLEHGSILRAAAAIHLTQPALSRSIQSLESELGVRLFDRGRRGIKPTPHGLALARHANALLRQTDVALAEIRGIGDASPTRVRIGVGTHLAGVALPTAIAGLVNEVRNVVVDVRDGSAEDLATALQRGELDAAICAWPAKGLPSGLHFEELLRSDLSVVCRSAHPLARRRHVALEELVQQRWALAERPRAIGEMLHLAFTAAGLPQPDARVRSTSLAFLLPLLQESDLVSLLPTGYLEFAGPEQRLVRLATDLPPATTRIGILRPTEGDAPSPALPYLIDALRLALRKAQSEIRRTSRK